MIRGTEKNKRLISNRLGRKGSWRGLTIEQGLKSMHGIATGRDEVENIQTEKRLHAKK